MSRDRRTLKLMYGSMYRENGSFIDNIAFVIDKNGGMLKWGEKEQVKKYFDESVKKYKISGLQFMIDDLLYIELDRYEGILSIDEICTLSNYIIDCSGNPSIVTRMFSMDTDSLKTEIERLKELGY